VLCVVCAVLGVFAAAIVALPADPRLAVAGAIPLTSFAASAFTRPQTVTLLVLAVLATGPAACAIAVARARQLRRAGADR
jgi:hypothetical protein